MIGKIAIAALATMIVAKTVQAQLIDKTTLTLDGAKKIMAAAEAKAKTEGMCSNGTSVFSPDGTNLGNIETGQPITNLAWGEDGRTLFMTGGILFAGFDLP